MQSLRTAWEAHPLWARRVAGVVLVVLAGAAAVTLAVPAIGDIVGPVGLFVGSVAGGVTFIVGARRLEGQERLSWTLVGVGVLLIAVGVVAVAVASSLSAVAAFGPTDVFFLGGYAIGIAGFAMLPQVASDWSQRLRVLLDGLIGGVSIGVLAWLTVLRDLLDQMQAFSAWDRWVGSAYPVLDGVAMVALLVVLVRRSTYRFDVRVLLVGVAFVVQSIADVVYLDSGIGKTFAEARPVYALNIAVLVLFYIGALAVGSRPQRREYAERETSVFASVVPYLLALIMVGALLVRVAQTRLDVTFWVLEWGAIAVGGLVTLRQSVAIRANRIRVEQHRSALVSSISHELRTPLTAVVGFMELLVNETVPLEPDERQEMQQMVYQQAGYMGRIVSDLILLARDSLDRVDLAPTDVTLGELLQSAFAIVDTDGAVVVVEADMQLQIHVDYERVQQLVVNLVSNAVRYGGGHVDLVVRDAGGTLVIEVHDDGPGVPKRHELRIWERFERGAHHLDATLPGSGIGLAVVQSVAKAHGGTADYRRSERLGGACFVVVLPHTVETGGPARTASPASAPRLEPEPTGG